jgi:hypothetical protein
MAQRRSDNTNPVKIEHSCMLLDRETANGIGVPAKKCL